MKKVNAAIGARFPKVFLVKGDGYYYVASDDMATGNKIGILYQTSIAISKLNAVPLNRWMQEVEAVMNDYMRHETERMPVFNV